jgi:hypothetical protein
MNHTGPACTLCAFQFRPSVPLLFDAQSRRTLADMSSEPMMSGGSASFITNLVTLPTYLLHEVADRKVAPARR